MDLAYEEHQQKYRLNVETCEYEDRIPRSFVAGLDLGQRADYSALSVIEKNGSGQDAVYNCRHLQRWKLHTPYPQIVEDTREVCMREPLLKQKPRLAIDSTGCGVPVVELFSMARPRINATVVPIMITGGFQVVKNDAGFNVPKFMLVSQVQASMQSGRLKIAAELPEASTLAVELTNFRAEISDTGRDTFGARSGSHDDLVLSLALALWLASQPEQIWSARELYL